MSSTASVLKVRINALAASSLWLTSLSLGLIPFSALGTEELADRPPPLPVDIGEEITADAVNLFFIFDRVFTQPPRARSANYLARTSAPSSASYSDYLEYRRGKISRAELVSRLPHVAMIGDSLTQNFYASTPLSMFWRARTERRKNWFLDTDPAPQSIHSVYERLDEITPLVAIQYSGAGALVAPSRAHEGLRRRMIRTRNLSGQARQVLRKKRFPDMIMIWIGHNNTDWVEGLSPLEREHPQKHMRAMAARFGENYTESLRDLLDRAKAEKHNVAVVVFGLVNFDAFFKGRRKAEVLHARNSAAYPYLETAYKSFESLKPPYQKNMALLGSMLDAEIQTMVDRLQRELKSYPNVRLQYSDALRKVDFSRLELINPADAWHLSIEGHKALAEAAFRAIAPSLEFVGARASPAAAQADGVHQTR
jgi:lysophospholipase L1-like esterase